MIQQLQGVGPAIFESIVAQLLERLEYGTLKDGTIKVLGRSRDGGIDGECTTDRLGLFKVKYQAKRWSSDRLVGVNDVRNFIGALGAEHAENGIFVTTSGFTTDVVKTAEKYGKIKLIDGEELARIMIESGLGVRTKSLDIPRVDEEYFTGLS